VLKDATEKFMIYLDTPADEKRKRRKQQQALKKGRNRIEHWFGSVPFLIKCTFQNKKSS